MHKVWLYKSVAIYTVTSTPAVDSRRGDRQRGQSSRYDVGCTRMNAGRPQQHRAPGREEALLYLVGEEEGGRGL